MNLIQSLGSRYCNDMISNAIILYEGRPAIIAGMGDSHCNVTYLDGSRESARVPSDYFSGWKVLAYPPLGYRRIGNAIFHVHRAQTAYRGIRAGILTFRESPMTALMQRHAERTETSYPMGDTYQRLASVVKPDFDNRASLDLLVSGRLFGVVPNEDFCIEPSTTENNYTVLYREKQVGTMDTSKRFTISNPAVEAFLRAAFTD